MKTIHKKGEKNYKALETLEFDGWKSNSKVLNDLDKKKAETI